MLQTLFAHQNHTACASCNPNNPHILSLQVERPGPTNQPQPVIQDPVRSITFPRNLTDPATVPDFNGDPAVFPKAKANLTDHDARELIRAAIHQILAIINDNSSQSPDKCSRCTAALAIAQQAAWQAPSHVPDAIVYMCNATKFRSSAACDKTYSAASLGASWTQLLFYANVGGLDGRYICSSLSADLCPSPSVFPATKAKFPKPRPTAPKTAVRSMTRAKVLHLSDLHLGEIGLSRWRRFWGPGGQRTRHMLMPPLTAICWLTALRFRLCRY